jgi:hypothetical protein
MMHFYDHDRPLASKCNDIISNSQLRKATHPDHAHFYSQQSRNETPPQKHPKHVIEGLGHPSCYPHYDGGIDALLRS